MGVLNTIYINGPFFDFLSFLVYFLLCLRFLDFIIFNFLDLCNLLYFLYFLDFPPSTPVKNNVHTVAPTTRASAPVAIAPLLLLTKL